MNDSALITVSKPLQPATSPNLSKPLNLTWCNSVKTSKVKHETHTWDAITVLLTKTPEISEDRSVVRWPLFIPFKMVKLEDGAKTQQWDDSAYSRCKANIVQMDLLVLDFDNDPKLQRPYLSYDEALQTFANLSFCIYTSFNHQNPDHKHGSVDKFRIVLPLLEPVTLDQVEERRDALAALFPSADPASFTASQPFYRPIADPKRLKQHRSDELRGEPFDLLALQPTIKAVKTPTNTNWKQTGDALTNLPNIRMKDGNVYGALELYNSFLEGYEHRKNCFRIDGADSKASCYIWRQFDGLRYVDNNEGKVRYIKVMMTKRVKDDGSYFTPEDDEELETSALWVRKPQVKLATPVTNSEPSTDTHYTEDHIGYVSSYREIQLNDRYLPNDLYLQIPEEGLTFIKAPKGTGKTTVLSSVTAKAVEQCKSVMLLGHRVYLLRNLATRTNLDYYLDLDTEEGSGISSNMALCMNSLTRLDPAVDYPYDILIIDEVEQVLQNIVSNHMKADLAIVFRNLLWVMKKAKQVICLDADLTGELTIELLQELRGIKDSDNVLAVINNYKIGAGQTTMMYEKEFHLLTVVLTAIEAGERAFIASNSKRFAHVVGAILKDMGKSVLVVSADTNTSPECKAFVENPTQESTKYDVVVSSPTLSTGVSIEGNHFTKVYGFFECARSTFQDVDQALSRVRHCPNVSVWVQGNESEPMIKLEESIYYDTLDTQKKANKQTFNDDTQLTQGQLRWARIYARLTYLTRLWTVNKDDKFAALRRELGFTIDHVAGDEELDKEGKSIYAAYKDVGNDRAEAIFNATEIYDDQAEELNFKRQLTHEEQLMLDRFNLYTHLKDDWTIDNVRSALKQELLRSLGRIRILHLDGDEARLTLDANDRKRNVDTFTANRHRSMQHSLIEHLTESANIDVDSLISNAGNGEAVEISKETLTAVAAAYNEKKRDFNLYFNSRIKDPTDQRNLLKVWDATFGFVYSLHLKKKKKGPRDNREMHYFLDVEKKDIVHAVLKKEIDSRKLWLQKKK